MQRMDITEAAVVQPYKKKPEDPPFLTVGTEVSAKYKGAFCEAKVHKVVKVVKVKVTFKLGLGSAVVSDDQVKGVLKIGAQVKASHPDKNQYVDAIVNKIQDCSQYTVVFDDGDITTLRRTSLCLKSGRHFAESETLDQLPLTHPEHFGTPVGGNRRGRRSRQNPDGDESGDEEDDNVHKRHRSRREEWEADIGKVVCVELGDKKKMKDNWFPGLVVAPTAQDSVKIETKKDYLVRSFQDGRYYTVPKKEASPFSREVGNKVSQSALKTAVEKALLFMTNDELPPHWDRDLLFGMDVSDEDSDRDGSDSDSSDDEPREEKDHFVAQLYKFMEECGTPINTGPTVGNKDLDLYKLFKVVQKLGGFNRVMNQNTWKNVSTKMQLQTLGSQAPNHIKNAYKKYLQSFEDFYRKLGCTMVSNPRGSRTRHRSGRSLIRDCDRTPRTLKKKENDSCDSTEDETEKKEEEEEKESKKQDVKKEKEETSKREVKKETEKKEPEKKDVDKKEAEKKEPEKKKEKEDGKSTRSVKQEVNKSPERESRSIRERSREPLLTREKSREPAVTRERSREPMAAKDKSREKSREPATSKERNRETASITKEVSSEPATPKEKREPRTPRSEAKTRSAVKGEAIEVKTRSSVKEEKVETIEVKTRSSVKEEIKKEDVKKEEKEASDIEEEEIEMAQTRSSKQREEKASTPTRKAKIERAASVSSTCTPSSTQSDNAGNDDKTEDIDVVSMSSTSSGALLSSVSAPSPSNSSSTASDKKATNSKNTKSKSAKANVVPTNPSVPVEDPSLKKRGRKKKQEGDVEHTVVYPYRGKALIPAHVPVIVGDKLRVLYGPNAKESKVTYEAKVLQVDEEGNSSMYYVHYLGWNTRYDEWVGRQRIAENTTWSQNRVRKGRAAATKELKEKKEKAKEKGMKKEDKDNVTAVPSPKSNLNKRGRSGTVIRERRESERSDVSGTSSISGPSTRATKDRNLTQPDSPSSVDSKRPRKSVQDTADSDSDEYESDVDTGSEKSRTRVSVERRMNTLSTSSASSTPTSEPCLASGTYVEKPTKETKIKTPPLEVKKEEEEGEEAKPCGKDIDLNAIMSEMKGLDKPIKKEEDRAVKEMPPRIIPAPVVMMPFASPEKKSVETPVKKCLESMPKKSESPSKPVAQEPVKLSPKLESLEDDIYEFKEPEPFDIGEMRARKDPRTKNSIGVVVADEQTDSEKFKKKARTRKDGDVMESDSDNNLSCQKKLVLTPSKRVQCDSKESVCGLDGSTTPEKKEIASASQPVVTTPGKVTSIVKKETPVKQEPTLGSPSEVKTVKPEMPKSPSPKLVQGEMPKSPSPLKESIRVAGTPVKTKTLTGVEKVGVSSHKPVGASSHILAQAVMPIIESKALAKPIPKPAFEPKLEKVPQVKVEEKVEPKVMSFSQRQQQIFPHLLNRPETTEKVKERIMASPMQSPSRDTSAQDNSVSNISTSDVDRIKRESSVEESIEAVIKRARQDQNEKLEESDKSETKSSPDKRRRTSNRVKKAISREFLQDTSEESDSDCRNPRLDAERRMRRGKMGPDGEKVSPLKRVYKHITETEKKKEKRDDDDMDDEDADEDDDDDEERGSVTRVLGKSGLFKKEESKTGNDEKKEEEEDEEEVESHLSRKKPRASASATPKRLEDEETETGLGDLLCEETIPPGSPMTHDPITADVDTPQCQDIKNEMPFASVPTGSSFGKRGPAPAAQQHSSQSQIPASQQQQQQQQQSSVPPPPPPPPSVHLKPTLKQPTPVKSPQILVPQAQPPQKLEPHHAKQQQQQSQQQKHHVQPQHIQTPQQQQQQIRQNPQQPPQQSIHQRQPPQPQTSPIQHQQPHHHIQPQQQQQQQHLQPLQQQQGKSQSQQDLLLPHQHTLKLHPHVHHQEIPHEQSTPQHQQSIDYQLQISSRHNPNVSNAIQSHNLNVVAAVAAAAASSRSVSSVSSSVLSTTAPSTSAAECGNMAASRNIRPSQNTVLDNTPPTTPESIISNLSDSPRGGDEGPKIDDSSKSGRDSSEVELDSLADNSKMDQFSEDSNTMDSTLGSDTRHHSMRGVPMKRQHDDNMEHDEVSETEESNNSSLASKRRRCRGPRVRAGNEGEDDDSRKLSSQGVCPGRRRRRHSSSRGGLPLDEDPETSGLSALSLACSAARRSRYNFCQELDPDLDASKRIAVLQSRIQELKRTYMQVKTELASVERRRKKLRRKEREKDAKSEPT